MLNKCLLTLALAWRGAFAFAADDTPEAAKAHWNMPVGVSSISREVHDLHMLIFWVCVGIGVIVFGAIFWSVIAHRRSRHPKPATFHESTTVEMIWTVIPFVILVLMAIPATGTLIRMEDTRDSDLTVKITGYQWQWQYEYVGEGVKFFSRLDRASNEARQLGSGIDPRSVDHYLLNVDHPLVLPVGKKVRLLMTAADVIHSWWVPALAVKKDAIPGFINETWTRIDTPGTYRGQCAELCGRDHGFMPIVVKAVPESDFEQWLEQMKKGGDTEVASAAPTPQAAPAPQPPAQTVAAAPAAKPPAGALSQDELMKQGEKAYLANCSVCHKPDGSGMPPTFPSLHGSKVVAGPAAAHIQQVLKGKNAMPPFAHLSDADIAAAVTYERNSWGNHSGAVQPADVAAQRNK